MSGVYEYHCPSCKQGLEWIGAANVVEPFWTRMGAFFKYPLSGIPLVLIVSTTLLEFVFLMLAFGGGLIALLVWLCILQYSFAALQRTAKGNMTPPPTDGDTLMGHFGPVLKQGVLYLLIVIVYFVLASKTYVVVGFVFLLAALFCLPAMIILLVVNEDLGSALNPAKSITLISRIGSGYLTMYFFLFLLGGAPAVISNYVLHFLPSFLQFFIVGMAQKYYTIISYHLMGYVLLQYHQQIGYTVYYEHFTESESQQPAAAPKGDDEVINRVDVLIKEMKLEEAITFIQRKVDLIHMTDPALAERYYKLLKMTKRDDELSEHAAHYMDILVKDNKRKKACELFLECRQGNGFRPGPETLFKAGQWLSDAGKPQEALQAYSMLTKVHSGDPLVPDAFFKGAQIMHDALQNTAKAKSILEGLLKKYPHHEIVPHVQHYLAHMRL